jgi:PEGA domain
VGEARYQYRLREAGLAAIRRPFERLRCQRRRSHWRHGRRNGGHQPCLLSRGTVFPVYARKGHQHSEGTEITAYVNGDVKLDIAKFQPAAPASVPAESAAAGSSGESVSAVSAKLNVGSDPPGADIAIDGGFVGNTPSDVQVTEGDHTVTLRKAGFKDWERKLKVSGGSSVHLNAELEKAATP